VIINNKYLENVTLLDLSNNSINSITPAAIENLQKEISLDLSNNELKTFMDLPLYSGGFQQVILK
jgi:Leucine-rich repeat (LRR) protein